MTNSRVSRQDAAAELLRRRLARRHLPHFTNYTFPQYQADPAHALIASKLDDVRRGEIKRLMIFAPPQHGKSELTSVRMPALWLGNRPDDTVILTSYAADLAESKSREARNLVESVEYQRLFPIHAARDSRAVNHWKVDGHRGGMLTGGVGGPITGHGAELCIIDDPVKNWEEAYSETYRERVWDWWRSTLRTRVREGAPIVLIMTRWHEDDLAGRLLLDQPGEWEVLRLPALAETQEERDESARLLGLPQGQPDPLGRAPGEALCPRRFSAETLEQIKRDVGPLVWWSLYQGVPRAPGGAWFKREMFPIVEIGPVGTMRIRWWDLADSEDSGARTAGVLMTIEPPGLVYVEHAVFGQWAADERDSVIRQTAQMDGRNVQVWMEQEPGSGGKYQCEALVRQLAGYPAFYEPSTGSKDARMVPFISQARGGNVRAVRGEWNRAYIDELCALPTGRYRDMADATSGAYNKLAAVGILRQVQVRMRSR